MITNISGTIRYNSYQPSFGQLPVKVDRVTPNEISQTFNKIVDASNAEKLIKAFISKYNIKDKEAVSEFLNLRSVMRFIKDSIHKKSYVWPPENKNIKILGDSFANFVSNKEHFKNLVKTSFHPSSSIYYKHGTQFSLEQLADTGFVEMTRKNPKIISDLFHLRNYENKRVAVTAWEIYILAKLGSSLDKFKRVLKFLRRPLNALDLVKAYECIMGFGGMDAFHAIHKITKFDCAQGGYISFAYNIDDLHKIFTNVDNIKAFKANPDFIRNIEAVRHN